MLATTPSCSVHCHGRRQLCTKATSLPAVPSLVAVARSFAGALPVKRQRLPSITATSNPASRIGRRDVHVCMAGSNGTGPAADGAFHPICAMALFFQYMQGP